MVVPLVKIFPLSFAEFQFSKKELTLIWPSFFRIFDRFIGCLTKYATILTSYRFDRK